MKNFIKVTIYIALLITVLIYREDITKYILKNFVFQQEIVLQDINEYRVNSDFLYVKYKNDFIAKNKSDIYNIIFSVINNGWNNFNFYCDKSYKSCISDVEELIENPYSLSYINNYVHPFNSYNKIHLNYTSIGRVQVVIDKLYTDEEISMINDKVALIEKNLYKNNMTLKDKIRAVHDYIINNTKYDEARANSILNKTKIVDTYQSHKAIGPLFEGMGICGGYSDAMAIFLYNLGVKNYRISNESHIWNYVYLDNAWYHLDLTWDDPVVSTKEDVLLSTYYLITTKKLEDINDGKHYYDKDVFLEAK